MEQVVLSILLFVRALLSCFAQGVKIGTGSRERPAHGVVAQMGEHLLCTQGVKGSSPFSSTFVSFQGHVAQSGQSTRLLSEVSQVRALPCPFHGSICVAKSRKSDVLAGPRNGNSLTHPQETKVRLLLLPLSVKQAVHLPDSPTKQNGKWKDTQHVGWRHSIIGDATVSDRVEVGSSPTCHPSGWRANYPPT